ncbi:Tetratricopeptide repeat protein 4 [Acropora cervicornis]|uniref:Tetratricopeptide repeat protein 4 n=1 Tax=Acropora cervicornis TaxID=6130 RepID=A0AAD9R6E9_ACRCE|nr:Tetratricopeptide repeat protein 4 [Acropora cervicornis]
MAEDANQSEVLPVEGANTLDSNKDLLSEKAEVFLCKGNERCREKDFVDAIRLYTEGIEVNCKDDEVKAKLHSNRAKAYFDLGARASFELKELEETITWCEKGLDIDHENSALSKLKETTISVLSKSQHEAEGKDPSDSSNTRSISEAEPENDANETNLRSKAKTE